MAERNPPVWLQSGTYSAEADRIVTSMLVDRVTTPAGVLTRLQSGVVPPSDQLKVRPPSGTSMTVQVGAGVAAIARNSTSPPGLYLCYNDGDETVSIEPAVSQNRVDLIIARVYDQEQGDSTSEWSLEVVKGSEAVNPVDPTLPTTSLKLARVLVRPAASNGGVNRINAADVTDIREYATGLGGVHVAWNGGIFPAPSVGRLCYMVQDKTLYVSDGVSWDQVMSKKGLQAYIATFRPTSAYSGVQFYVPRRDTWGATSYNFATAAPFTFPSTGWFNAPSGSAKISVQAYGRTTHSDVAGHISFIIDNFDTGARVLGGVQASVYGWGPSFYTTAWSTGHMSSIITGLPTDARMVVTPVYRVEEGAVDQTRRLIVARMRITVEPVIG